MKKAEASEAWVIHSHSCVGHGFLGIGWFGWPKKEQAHLLGYRTATFETRDQAREALKKVKTPFGFSKAKVHRVKITTEILD